MSQQGFVRPIKSPGVFPEDYFRCMQENKQISQNYKKSFKKKTDMALSRFDDEQSDASLMPGGAANALVAGNPGLGPLAKRLMMDPDIDEYEALSLIQLPSETMYLIDKVVRQKSKAGPIGIENSELVNLELENEFKKNNNYVFKLNSKTHVDDQEQYKGYVDEQGVYHGVDQDEKLFKENEKLLSRLTMVAAKEIQPRDYGNDDTNVSQEIYNISNQESNGMGPSSANLEVKEMIQDKVNGDNQNMNPNFMSSLGQGEVSEAQKILELQARAKKISHESWVRRKDHENQLRMKLITEAKRDLLETLVYKQQEEALRMQERSHQMFEWDNKKKMIQHHEKLVKLQKDQKERLEKQQKQEISYMKFKEWLKTSLIKQRVEENNKKLEKRTQKVKEQDDKRTKAHRRVLAKIAYKDWKQTKQEEAKLLKRKQQIERRQGMFDTTNQSFSKMSQGPRLRKQRYSSARALKSDASSKYINTDHKRNQIQTREGGPTQLAYSLNKNMNNLKISDHKKKRPKTATRKPPRQAKPQRQPMHDPNQQYMNGIYQDQEQYQAQQQQYLQEQQYQQQQQQVQQQLEMDQQQQQQQFLDQQQEQQQQQLYQMQMMQNMQQQQMEGQQMEEVDEMEGQEMEGEEMEMEGEEMEMEGEEMEMEGEGEGEEEEYEGQMSLEQQQQLQQQQQMQQMHMLMQQQQMEGQDQDDGEEEYEGEGEELDEEQQQALMEEYQRQQQQYQMQMQQRMPLQTVNEIKNSHQYSEEGQQM